MAFDATSLSARRLHLDLAARLSLKAEEMRQAVRGPTMRLLGPVRQALPRLLGSSRKPRKSLILICDGEELILDLLEHHLKAAGYEVMRAADGNIALEMLGKRTPAVAILAIDVPGILGTEVLQRIRETPHQRHVPVIMLTDRHGEADVVGALRMGASDYLTKPFLIGEVLERVSKHITPYEHPLESVLEELAA